MAAPQDAQALSFGRVRSAVILGQPLSVAIPITLDDNEQITPECLRAEVLHGESNFPANVVRARMTQGTGDDARVVRVTTTAIIQEPVVVVTVQAGCPARVSRSYTLLADPPVLLPSTAPGAEQGSAASADNNRVAANPDSNASVGGSSAGNQANGTPKRTKQENARNTSRAATAPRNPSLTSPSTDADRPSPPTTTAAAPRPDRPRLQLDGGAVTMSRSASDAADDAAVARANLRAAEAAASAAESRLRLLETEILRLRADSKLQLEAMTKMQAQMQAQTAQADQASRWMPWVLAVALLSTLAALWMAVRMRQMQQAKSRRGWWANSRDFDPKDAGAETAVPSPTLDSRLRDAGLPEPKLPKIKVPSAASEGANTRPRAVMPMHGNSLSATPISSDFADAQRAVTVDEQIDLEQEADFFIALGHDDAAIDLLLAHLRSTGGSAPLPYLKLLDMYRRRGDRDDYELMRRRFNQRFNSVAPEWEHDPLAGRVLEDYPLLLKKLQNLWPKPINAMAELEAMAFGRSGDDRELIDLPAYQDVLFLYQMARGLHDADRGQAGAEAADDVDVLLPLEGDSPPEPIMATLTTSGPGSTGLAPLGAGLVMPLSISTLDLDISSGVVPLTPAPPVPYRGNPVGELPKIDLDLPLNDGPSFIKK